MLDAVDLNERLIQMPLPFSMLVCIGRSSCWGLASENRFDAVDPEPNASMTDIDATLMKKGFNIAQ